MGLGEATGKWMETEKVSRSSKRWVTMGWRVNRTESAPSCSAQDIAWAFADDKCSPSIYLRPSHGTSISQTAAALNAEPSLFSTAEFNSATLPAMGESSGKPPRQQPAAAGKEEEEEGELRADNALHALGFEFTRITAEEVSGRLAVTETCCQPFKMLNGGVSALMAEATASIGAYMASGFRRVAGVQLSINHLRPARLGDVVRARATPVQRGRNIQVWDVQVWRVDPSTSECKDLVSAARVTVLVNLSTPEEMTSYKEGIKKYSKL